MAHDDFLHYVWDNRPPVEFLLENAGKIDFWGLICELYRFTDEQLDSLSGYLDFDDVCRCQPLSSRSINKYANKINWILLSNNPKVTLTDDDTVKYFHLLNAGVYMKRVRVSDSVILSCRDLVDYKTLSRYTNLGFDTIWELRDKLDWNVLSYTHKFTGEQYKALKDYIVHENNWYYMDMEKKLDHLGLWYTVESGEIGAYCVIYEDDDDNNYVLASGKKIELEGVKQCDVEGYRANPDRGFPVSLGFHLYPSKEAVHDAYGSAGYGYYIQKVAVSIKDLCMMDNGEVWCDSISLIGRYSI